MSSNVHLLTDLIASAQAADHCEYFAALPSEIKGMFLIRARRGLGLTAHRGWAPLLIDRMDTQVQRPEFPQAHEPAWGSTKASARVDEAMYAHDYHHPPSGFNAGFARLGAQFLCWLKPDPPRRGGFVGAALSGQLPSRKPRFRTPILPGSQCVGSFAS